MNHETKWYKQQILSRDLHKFTKFRILQSKKDSFYSMVGLGIVLIDILFGIQWKYFQLEPNPEYKGVLKRIFRNLSKIAHFSAFLNKVVARIIGMLVRWWKQKINILKGFLFTILIHLQEDIVLYSNPDETNNNSYLMKDTCVNSNRINQYENRNPMLFRILNLLNKSK